MGRVMFERDLLFAALIALAIHVIVALTHIYSAPLPLHFKAKDCGHLNITMVSTYTADAVPEVKKERKEVVKKEREISKPNRQSNPIFLKEVKTLLVSQSASEITYSFVPTGKELLETAKVTLAVPQYDENMPPIYPAIARKRGYEGAVMLSAEVLIDGRVGKLRIKKSSGYHILDRSALKAVKKWKFEPARRLGFPIAMWVEVPVRFVLKDK